MIDVNTIAVVLHYHHFKSERNVQGRCTLRIEFGTKQLLGLFLTSAGQPDKM